MGESRFDSSVLNRLHTPGIITGSVAAGDRPANPGGEGWIFIDNDAANIYTYSTDLSAWVLIGSGGGGATSGSGITVVGTAVNLGRTATPLTVDANLVTTGGFKIYINPNADGALLDFDQVNFNTYVNGGIGNTAIQCCFLGLGSGRNNSGAQSVLIGQRAGNGNTAALLTAVGYAAGDTQTGVQSSFLGNLSGDHNTGARATGVGYSALKNNTGTDATAIGHTAGLNNTNSNVILLGRSASATANNQLALGFTFAATLNFNSLSANRFYDMQDVSGIIALLKNGNGITASATGFDLGGNLIQSTDIDQAGFDFTVRGNGAGLKSEPGSQLTSMGDVDGSGSGSIFAVNDSAQKLSLSANLVTAPGAVAITTDFIKILVAGVDYYIPLYQ